jgi:hypothetical protein
VQSEPAQAPAQPDLPAPARHAGRAVLIGVLGIALIMIGGMLVAMLQAPVVRPRVIVTGFVLLASGFLLLSVAWRYRRSHVPDEIPEAPMPQMLVNLSPDNTRKLEVCATQTGKSHDQLLNDAVEQLEVARSESEVDWKAAILQADGLWKDRHDLPDFEALRRSADRDLWSR